MWFANLIQIWLRPNTLWGRISNWRSCTLLGWTRTPKLFWKIPSSQTIILPFSAPPIAWPLFSTRLVEIEHKNKTLNLDSLLQIFVWQYFVKLFSIDLRRRHCKPRESDCCVARFWDELRELWFWWFGFKLATRRIHSSTPLCVPNVLPADERLAAILQMHTQNTGKQLTQIAGHAQIWKIKLFQCWLHIIKK